MENQESQYKRLSQDQTSRIKQLEYNLEKKCSTIAKLSTNIETVQSALKLEDERVRELVLAVRSQECVLSSLRNEWTGQEKRMRNEHQVDKIVTIPQYINNCIDDLIIRSILKACW